MYLPNFLDGFDRLVAFDAETTGKRTPDAQFVRKQPFAWRAPGIIIEVGFVEMLREGEGWRKGETWSSRVNPDGPIDPEAIKIRQRPASPSRAHARRSARQSAVFGFDQRVASANDVARGSWIRRGLDQGVTERGVSKHSAEA